MFKERKEPLMIAEISCNHGQNYNTAQKLIVEAKKNGADAVKFQAYTPDTMTINCDNDHFKIKHPKWGGQTLYELYNKSYAPWSWFPSLKKHAEEHGLIFLCTAFDKTSVDMLESLNICAHKISSFEMVDLDLIRYVASTKKPLMISTGMASVSDIDAAVDEAVHNENELLLFKCVSSYPADPEEMNINIIEDMKTRFEDSAGPVDWHREKAEYSVGLSDHSLGCGAAIAASLMGVKAIEKHLILSRYMNTSDNFFSMQPEEFKYMVDNVKIALQSLGKVHYGCTKNEAKSSIFRRSLFVVKDIKKGDRFTRSHIRCIRPSNGLAPMYLDDIIDTKATIDIAAGTPLQWEHSGKWAYA